MPTVIIKTFLTKSILFHCKGCQNYFRHKFCRNSLYSKNLLSPSCKQNKQFKLTFI